MQGVIQGVAGGTINPARFVKLSTSENNTFLQGAAATDITVGISTEGTQDSPLLGGTDAAADGEQFLYHQLNTTPVLELGGTVTAGDELTSDANGKGVAASADEFCGAIAIQAGVSGEKIKVLTTAFYKSA